MNGIELIRAERERQVAECGWSAEHDDKHDDDTLCVTAAICACNGTDAHVEDYLGRDAWNLTGKYGYRAEKPDRVRLLAVAGALIAAEIDRIQRADERKTEHAAKTNP